MKRLRRWLRLRRPTFGGLVRATAVLTLIVALFASPAVAYYQTPGLNGVASSLAGRKVYVRCLSPQESFADPVITVWGASGYVEGVNDPLTGRWRPNNYTTLAYGVCETLIGLASLHTEKYTVYDLSWAVLVLTHESGHLRGAWWSSSESRTECWAMKHLKSTLNQLGIRDQARQQILYYYAKQQHMLLPTEYLTVSCRLP